jgi:hypothetical protein
MAAQIQFSKDYTFSQQQKLYRDALKKALLAELDLLFTVVVMGQQDARIKIDIKVAKGILNGASGLVSLIPKYGNALAAILSSVGEYLLDVKKLKEDTTKSESLLASLLTYTSSDRGKLDNIIDVFANEAACRWDMAINYFISDHPSEIMKFADAGAVRVIEYLCRKKVEISHQNLLRGLVAGCPNENSFVGKIIGKELDKITITVKPSMQQFLKSENISAEGLYGRTGHIIDGKYYITNQKVLVAGTTAIGSTQVVRAKKIESQKGQAEDAFHGFVQFIEDGQDRLPRFGYIQLSNLEESSFFANINSHGYQYIEHTPDKTYRIEKDGGCPAKARVIGNGDIKKYLEYLHNSHTAADNKDFKESQDLVKSVKSLNQFLQFYAFYRDKKLILEEQPSKKDKDILVKLKASFRASNFDGACIEDYTLSDFNEVRLNQSKLIRVTATGDSLYNATLIGAKIESCFFKALNCTKVNLAFANITRTDLTAVINFQSNNLILDNWSEETSYVNSKSDKAFKYLISMLIYPRFHVRYLEAQKQLNTAIKDKSIDTDTKSYLDMLGKDQRGILLATQELLEKKDAKENREFQAVLRGEQIIIFREADLNSTIDKFQIAFCNKNTDGIATLKVLTADKDLVENLKNLPQKFNNQFISEKAESSILDSIYSWVKNHEGLIPEKQGMKSTLDNLPNLFSTPPSHDKFKLLSNILRQWGNEAIKGSPIALNNETLKYIANLLSKGAYEGSFGDLIGISADIKIVLVSCLLASSYGSEGKILFYKNDLLYKRLTERQIRDSLKTSLDYDTLNIVPSFVKLAFLHLKKLLYHKNISVRLKAREICEYFKISLDLSSLMSIK